MMAKTTKTRHQELVEKRLMDKFHLKNMHQEKVEEHKEISDMVARVAKLAADDTLREDGTTDLVATTS
jgi:hypothetical protein